MAHIQERLHFEAQGHFVRVAFRESAMHSQTGKSATRGKITTFSRKSRKRMLEKTARLSLDTYVKNMPILFVTLTYGQDWPHPSEAKTHMRNLWKRIVREYSTAAAIWRLEFQKRGAPHLHLLIFNVPFISKDVLKQIWSEIIEYQYWDYSAETPRAPFTRIEALRSGKKAMAYVSKYVAKNEDEAVHGFNYVPYLTAGVTVGRVWGVLGSKFLPWGEIITGTVELPRDDMLHVLWQFRRLMAKRWQHAAKSGRHRGASLFVDHVQPWHRAFIWCLTEYCYDKYHSPA